MPPPPCPRCGTINAVGDLYCARCGGGLSSPSTVSPAPAAWAQPAQTSYAQPVMLPGWLTLGMVLVIIGGLLVLVGFFVNLVGTAGLNSNSTLASIQGYYEAEDALIGIGAFVVILGWVFHQAAVHRRHL